MKNEQRKKLLKAQQGELGAVVLYKKLSEQVKQQEKKEILLRVSSDEGRHAAILRNYTNEILKPMNRKANIVLFLYKILGAKMTFNILSDGELRSIKGYKELVEDFPEIQTIIDDEIRHAAIAKKIIE